MKTQENLHGRARFVGYAFKSIGHLSAIGILSGVVAIVSAPHTQAWSTYGIALNTPWMRDDTLMRMGFHIAISACLWAMTFLIISAFRAHKREKQTRVLKMARGSVMTETIIVLPIWMLLVFGLAQLAVNNIAGVLANVAVYEAARAAWVWDGEGRGTGGGGQGGERARIAAAAVMTPVAPGEFAGNPFLPAGAEKMRKALALSHVPLSSAVAGIGAGDVQNMLANLGSLNLAMPTESNKSVMRALDTEAFLLRTLKKFTHAYHATSTTVSSADGRVTMKSHSNAA